MTQVSERWFRRVIGRGHIVLRWGDLLLRFNRAGLFYNEKTGPTLPTVTLEVIVPAYYEDDEGCECQVDGPMHEVLVMYRKEQVRSLCSIAGINIKKED